MKTSLTESEYKRELEEANAQLFHTSRLSQLGEMAMAAARETNILINAISRTNQLIKHDTEIVYNHSVLSKLEEKIKHIDLQVERIKRIIDSPRVFARREMDSRNFQLTDVSKVARETLSLIGEQLKHRDIRIDMDFSKRDSAPTFPVFVVGRCPDSLQLIEGYGFIVGGGERI